MEGRDIGTVVFPQAEVKIFLDAAPEVRGQRRYEQMGQRGARPRRRRKKSSAICAPATNGTATGRIRRSSLRSDAVFLDSTSMTLEAGGRGG